LHLRKTLIMSFDMTIRGLFSDGAPVSVDSMNARNELICLVKGDANSFFEKALKELS
jgi:hypothetical protein